MDVIGRSAGSVRPPLTPLSEQEKQQLATLVSAVSRQALPA
jgi:dihydrodipicolinate synthase/N-acetylneuraminate lyase